MATNTIHLFEERGLGVAPFRFVREVDSGSVRSGCTCDYCGTAIRYIEVIEDSKGQRFHVGNECVKKTGDKGLIDTARRARSQARAQAKYEAQREATEKAWAEQRERNGGLTDHEKTEKDRFETEARKHQFYANYNAWLFPCLEARAGSDFCKSMLYSLKRGPAKALSARAREIIADIYARGESRSRPGYPKYEQAYDEAILRMADDGIVFFSPELAHIGNAYAGGPIANSKEVA